MKSTVYAALYERLSNLLPDLRTLAIGQSFVAPPRVTGDLTLFCRVSKVDRGVIELVISHDQDSCPWIVFEVDPVRQMASVLLLNETPPAKGRSMNLLATNLLSIMVHLGIAFRPSTLKLQARSLA
jgi:hypothetical protein